MKKILFLMPDLEGGGAERALINLLREFDYTKYKVTLCLMYHRGVYLDAIPAQVHTIYLFKNERSFFFRKAWKRYIKYNKLWSLSFLIKCRLKKHYDVIISYLEGSAAFWHNIIIDRGKRNISWIHVDMLKYHSSHNAYRNHEEDEKRCYQKMDQLVFVSQIAMENFSKLYDIDVPKCCLYNVISKSDIYKKASVGGIITKSVFTITAIGSLLEVKGFDRLIRVAEMLKKDGISFCIQIIGHGEKEAELKRLVHELNVENEVHFLGFQANPYPYLKESDIFISTSISEGFSLVICEALVLGIPIVATNTAGALELLEGGEYGVITEQNDLSIYVALKKYITDETLRTEYHKKSLLRANIFEVQSVMSRFYEVIQ